MRLPLLIAAALAALAFTSPAAADVTVRYAPASDGGQSLVIEADDQGRVRAEGARGQLIIIRDGETYMSPPNAEGMFAARLEDFFAVGAEMFNRLLGEGMQVTRPSGYMLNMRGPETVGQWQGILYSIDPVGAAPDSGSGSQGLELVVSTDPALSAAGRASGQVFGALIRTFAMAFGGEAPELTSHAQEVLGRGTVLRMDRQFRLQSVDNTGRIPASRFDLPGPVLSRDQLRARMLGALEQRQE